MAGRKRANKLFLYGKILVAIVSVLLLVGFYAVFQK
jgi:hypothetical protein